MFARKRDKVGGGHGQQENVVAFWIREVGRSAAGKNVDGARRLFSSADLWPMDTVLSSGIMGMNR
jgi:hypothetical protein